MEHMRAYGAHPPPPPPPPHQQFNHGSSQHQNPSTPPAPRQQPRRELVQNTAQHTHTNAMSSTFAPFPAAYETQDFVPWGPPNGNMMAINNGFPLRHAPSSPPPTFHHQSFQAPPPPPSSTYFTSNVSGYQSHIPAGMLSPLHSPPLGPVGMHMGAPSFAPHNAHMAYQNILPPQESSGRGGQQQQQQHQMPPRPNFMYGGGGMQRDHSGPGQHMGSYMPNMTPPVSVPSSPSPQPGHQAYHTRMDTSHTPPPHGVQPLSPLILSTSTVSSGPTHSSSYRSQNVPTATYSPSTVPRTVPARGSPLSSSILVASSTPLPAMRDDPHAMTPSPKPRLNPDASPFMPVVKSPAIVSSTPPPPPKAPAAMRNGHGTPPTRPRAHPFSMQQQQDEEDKQRSFNPAAPAFVPPKPSASSSPPLNAPTGPRTLSRTPPPNAPTGPSSMTSRGNRTPPTGPSSHSRTNSFSRLSLSPPSGPRAERERNIPPPPNFGLGIEVGAASRGLPANTPSGPRAMNKPSTPSGPRSMTSTPNGPRSMTPTNGRPMTPTGPQRHGSLARHNSSYKPNSTMAPVVAKTMIEGIDKPVPTAPASMLVDLAPAASIIGVPTAPKAMREAAQVAAAAASSVSGSDDGRGRPEVLSEIAMANSLIYPQRSSRSFMRKALSEREGSRDGSVTPAQTPVQLPTAMSIEVKAEDLLTEIEEEQVTVALIDMPLAAEPEQVEEKAVEEIVEVQEVLKVVEEVAAVEVPVEEELSLPTFDVVSIVEKTESEADTIVVTPECEVLPASSPFMAKAADEQFIQPIAEVVEVEIVAAAPAPLPVIQIEADDLTRKEIDLDQEELPRPSSRAQRLSAISKENDKDIIVSMKIEDGVLLVPMETPDLNVRTFAKTTTIKAKDEATLEDKETVAIAVTEVAPVAIVAATVAAAATTVAAVAIVADVAGKTKETKKSNGTKQPDLETLAKVLNSRTPKSNKKKAKKTKKQPAAKAPSVEEPSTIATPVEPEQKPQPEVAVIVAPSAPKGTPTSFVKNTEVDVGFAPETKATDEEEAEEAAEVVAPVVEAAKPVVEEIQEKPIKEVADVQDVETTEEEVLEEKVAFVEVTVPKAASDEVEQDGGVSLELAEAQAIALPLSPAVEVIAILEEPVLEVTEIKALPEAIDDVVEEIVVPAVEKEEEPVQMVALIETPVEMVALIETPVEMVALIEEPVEVAAPVVEKALEVSAPVVEKPVEIAAPVVEKSVEIPAAVESIVEEPVVEEEVEAEFSPVLVHLNEFFQPYSEDEVYESEEPEAIVADTFEKVMLEPRHVEETTVSIDSIIKTLASCKDVSALSKSLDNYSKVVKAGTQEERLFKELSHYTISSSPLSAVDNDDKASTRSKSSVRSFFKRGGNAYPKILSSTTARIKAILPPFLNVGTTQTAASAATPPPSRPMSRMGLQHSASTASAKPTRPRLLPKVTMSLLNRSFSLSRSGSFSK
ncbi:hypothetical protein DFH27DRAFT_640833 [Peziza echinospora]|nr:hypothetical protein DFH27DRAFT_640833 [Peziza echinospora]